MKRAPPSSAHVLSSIYQEEVSIFTFVGNTSCIISVMSMRRRRYQSLGLMKRSHNQPRGGRPLEGVEKFVSESHVNDIILYNRVSRARPGIRQLEFPDDDVDWQLEYFCGELGKWMSRLLGWLLGIFESFMRFLGFRRKDDNDDDDNGNEEDGTREKRLMLYDQDFSRGDGRFNETHKRIAQLYPDVIWRFENCIPFLNRRILKRKWFLNPRTKEWADDKVDLFRKHVKRGFRTLCSGVGKDTKIYVLCSPTEASATNLLSLSTPSSPHQYIFRADSKVLKSHSLLFREWFLGTSTNKIVTTFVTPQEMQALLVYMYTLTWPTDMLIPTVGRRGTLDPRFLEVLQMHGMTLNLTEETPPMELRRPSNLLATLVEEEPPGEDENQNVVIVNENNRSFLKAVPSSPHLIRSSNVADGQGDCSKCFQETEILQYATEKESHLGTPKDLAGASNSSSSDRSLKASKFAKIKDSLKVSLSPNHRVHPETILTSDQRDRLRITNNQTTSFVALSVDTENGKTSRSDKPIAEIQTG